MNIKGTKKRNTVAECAVRDINEKEKKIRVSELKENAIDR